MLVVSLVPLDLLDRANVESGQLVRLEILADEDGQLVQAVFQVQD